jgi:hypothetical protein
MLKRLVNIIFVFIFFILCHNVFASEANFRINKNDLKIGEYLKIDFTLNADQYINAFGGKVLFSTNYLKLENIIDGNSIVSIWAKQPTLFDNKISFLGITPGGFKGNNGILFSLIFRTLKSGQTSIETENIKFLLNDGNATNPNVKDIVTNLNIKAEVIEEENIIKQEEEIKQGTQDTDKTEIFTPEVYFDKDIDGGKNILIFNTEDKGVGIDHYEISEGDEDYKKAESPYILQDQELSKEIKIKAIDKNGNYRLVVIPPQKKEVVGQKIGGFSLKEKFFIAGSLLFLIFVLKLAITQIKKKVKDINDRKNL